MTFASLALEVEILTDLAKTEYFNALLAYGEDVDGCLDKEGGSVKMMARFLPFLQELSVLVNRCYEVFRNFILQLHHFFVLKAMQMMHHNPSQFGAESEYLRPLQSVIVQIDSQIMSGFIFKNCCEQAFSEELHTDSQFIERMRNAILEMHEKWDHVAGELGFSSFLLAFHLIGEIIWTPCDFLVKSVNEIERVLDRKSLQSIASLRSSLFDQQAELLIRETITHSTMLMEWQCKMAEELREWPKENAHGHLIYRTTLFFKGARQVDSISRLLRTVLNGHLYEQKAISRSAAVAIFRLVELIKAWVALEMACYTKIFRWNEVQEMDEFLIQLDVLLNLGTVLSNLCDCSFLYSHRSIMNAYFDSLLDDSTAHADVSFCYTSIAVCSLSVSSTVLMDNIRSNSSIYFQLFFEAICDAEIILKGSRQAESNVVTEKFYGEIYDEFQQRFLLKLCEAIETDLRLSIHSHLQLDEQIAEDLSAHWISLLFCEPIRLGERLVDIKRYVERYLERTFYNLNAVALHDCNTYTEMRLLAENKYGLILCDSRLPFQTLEQGLDVLLITRNIHSFVTTYNYNLNAQFFIENDSKNKQLNILTVEHIANSIRTHGMGIMNTTINFAYQYLKKKFFIFSQFLFDDHIKGQLAKDIRFFHDNTNELNKMYPVKRAQRFNTAIRRLGVTSDDLSFLGKFRILITQIGNVMGYVRLVRSGGIEASSQSLAFIPDLDDIPSFVPLTAKANLSKESVNAAKILDGIFDDATKNMNQTNNYLQILLEVFAKEFRNFAKFDHLRSFFIIVPPLTINFVEHILACKGKLGRRSKQNNTFTDDGFILGVAFILTLLNQLNDFSALNWFESIESKCLEEMKNTSTSKMSSTRLNTNTEPSTTLRIAKLEQYQKEFRLLFYNFSSAKIFFRAYQGFILFLHVIVEKI
ncbi:unnamed protein product [Anisakis simplex]|uniref:WASH complex subunit 7 (inferred by orthology to a human protein) n=1 Tax=Anisakis simplex TaxID=6269 RepID=A0A158PN65_ANISI|nr:unnamed protein product [Anisakis simplex]